MEPKNFCLLRMRRVVVQEEDFEPGVEIARLGDEAAGAVASFVGIVRAGDDPLRRVAALTLEHYPGMTEKALEGVAAAAGRQWPLTGCSIIHRVGRLLPGQNIVFVGVASAHRRAALEACGFMIDWLKVSAPFWKREEMQSGEVAWVAAREEDESAAKSWDRSH